MQRTHTHSQRATHVSPARRLRELLRRLCLGAAAAGLCLGSLVACDGDDAQGGATRAELDADEALVASGELDEEADADAEGVARADDASDSSDARPQDPAARGAKPKAPPEQPLGYRVAKRTTMVYFEPRFGSELRGRVDKHNSFAIYELVKSAGAKDECDEGEGWARVADHGYVCLRRYHEETERPPAPQPVLPEGLNVPYIYAHPEQDRAGNVAIPVPRYRSKFGLFRGQKPSEYLVGNRQYAFVELKRSAKFGKYLVDEHERVVPSVNMNRERPSEHFGRLLGEQPAADGLLAGWVVRSDAEIKDRAQLERGKVVRKPDYHSFLDVRPELERHKGEAWYRVPDAVEPGVDGWILRKNVRVWRPDEPLAEVKDDEYWIDIDLAQQVLALYKGDEVELITLISSGNGKHPTPRGIFRLRGKQSVGKMESKDDATPDEVYYVEAVPWVQYFYKRYALHTSYWHNRFGHQHSHGCVNLAPAASKYVFDRTYPRLPAGWSSANETPDELGTTIRLRRRDDELPDKRKPIGEPDDEDEDEGDELGLTDDEDDEDDDE
ncbi:MAG: L,D-transpeptidase [Myxococcales bacterium]|nr:L,D-transpeptidase [Myxococcales bacterium]